MPRAPVVTRTIWTTRANVMCLDIEREEPFNKEVILPRTYKDEKAMLKQAEKVINNETIKAVHIVDFKVEETRYGMTEQQFIEQAEVIPALKK